jgi:hypothetical protein
MNSAPSASGPLAGLTVALSGLGVLVFGGLLSYYGDADVAEYRWKGPVAAILIVIVCVAIVVALQHPALGGRMRAIGYVGVVALGSYVAFSASATYYDERCDDPGYVGDCGIPVLGAMLWGAGAAACLVALVVVIEFRRKGTSEVVGSRSA